MNEDPIDETREDVAIIGMACLFPGAPNLEAYWRNIVGKVDATSDPPPEAWDANVFYDPNTPANDRVYCKRGGFIAPIAEFDPLDNGVMPRTVEGGEPDQWLALSVARQALADAGYGDDVPERRNTAVILGKGTYLNRGNLSVVQHGRMVDQTMAILETLHPELGEAELQEIRSELKRKLPPFNSDTAPGLIPNIIAGRIANRLDLMGPNYTVDAACASSIVAVDHAMRGLRSREYDLALAGGVHVATPVPTLMLFCQLGALSRREAIRPFDALADGTLLGGGLGMVVLKRLSDAKRDGNRIYATLKSVGVSSDGRGLGVMAPRPEGEELALRRAYEAAGIDPRTVGLIEAHGTGTPVGDATEVKALTTVFGERGNALPWCGLGTVKSMIGHAMPAAGIAGIIKTALALHHRVLPPTLHVDEPNPKLKLEVSPFYLNTEVRPWIHGSVAPRRAGVNAFGFGGINAHAILEEASSTGDSLMPWSSEVVVLSGGTRAELIERAADLFGRLEGAQDLALADVAYSMNVPLAEGRARLALVAESLEDLRTKLRQALTSLEDPKRERLRDVRGIYYAEAPFGSEAKLAFVFPGEGSQYLGMLSELCTHFPEVRQRFDLVDRIFRGHARNFVPSDFIFPRPVFSEEDRRAAEARLWQMEGAFEAVLTADWAIYELLQRLGVEPHALLGHSTGEYAAMRASGMMPLETDEDVVRFARSLNDLYYRQGAKTAVASSSLVALGAEVGSVREALGADAGKLYIAMDNCPHQTVVVGNDADVDGFLARARERGWIYERLSFDRPYHTPLFERYSEGLRGFLAEWIGSAPKTPLYSCTSASRFPRDVESCRELAWKHWMSPVRFRETIEAMHDEGVRIFVEVGPRGNLSAFVDDALRGRPHLAVPADAFARSGVTQLHHLVGLLAVHGVPLRLDPLYEGRRARRIDRGRLGDAAEKKRRPMKLEIGWIPMEISEEAASRLRKSGKLGPEAGPAPKEPDGNAEPVAASAGPLPPSAERDAVMSSYWRTMDQFLSLQQETMEGFLAGGGAPARGPQTEVVRSEAPSIQPSSPEGMKPSPVPAAAPEPESEPPPAEAPAVGLRDLLLDIVSDRTGYPIEMIGLDLDLEADLGIDSIKRVEILGSLQQRTKSIAESDMENLSGRRTLGEVLRYLEEGAAPEPVGTAPSVEASPRGIFLRSVKKLVPGDELVAECALDLEEDAFLRDHALGRGVATTMPELSGLPVVPMTMGMEMLAEAALGLFGGELRVVGMRDVRAYRWMMLEGETGLAVRISAKRSGENEARAKVEDLDGTPIVEGTVLIGPEYPEPPEAEPLALAGERPSRWTRESLYEEIMFHGPRFRGVRSMERFGEDGATASLATLPLDRLFASTDRPELALDPVLLDQPGQVVGFWTAEHLERGFVVFPYHLDRLDLFAPPGGTPETLECRARIRLLGEELVDSDLDVVGPDGKLVCRLAGWKDRRFDVPSAFLRFLHRPAEERLTSPWPVALASVPEAESFRSYRLVLEGFPESFFTAHGGVWQEALALLILGPAERREWRALERPPAEKLRWLLERLVAKDAVRSFVRERSGLVLAPADVPLPAGAHDRMSLEGPWEAPRGPLTLALSRSGDEVVAVVGRVDAGAGLSVALGRLGVSDADASELTSAEERLLESVGSEQGREWSLRLRAAKQAAIQGLAEGPVSPRELVIEKLDPNSQRVWLRLNGDEDRRVAYTAREGDLVVATYVPFQQRGEDLK